MQLWLIPTIYAVASVIGGFVLPRLEARYLGFGLDVSIASAQAYLSAVASGMMALTGIVFSIAFVLVQFNAIVYSPRLVIWFARDRLLFHSMGVFVATFMYSLSTLARGCAPVRRHDRRGLCGRGHAAGGDRYGAGLWRSFKDFRR